ncbi:hypothetical protein MUP79_10250 [Candidatus Bathyarchaeota archaeon]|nr:hypothetical protein [Candidatus Bathyarchaeota archaeon]
MTNWRKRINIKHLLTKSGKHKDIVKSMNSIADVLEKHFEFKEIAGRLRNIPKGDDVITPADYANKLLERVYDIADNERIWIE